MVSDLPSYVFFLLCCFKPDCPHPRCQCGRPESPLTWYPGGPPLFQLPLSASDSQRPWGGHCDSCNGVCSGHYVTKFIDVYNRKSLSEYSKPPSAVMKELFSAKNGNIEETTVDD